MIGMSPMQSSSRPPYRLQRVRRQPPRRPWSATRPPLGDRHRAIGLGRLPLLTIIRRDGATYVDGRDSAEADPGPPTTHAAGIADSTRCGGRGQLRRCFPRTEPSTSSSPDLAGKRADAPFETIRRGRAFLGKRAPFQASRAQASRRDNHGQATRPRLLRSNRQFGCSWHCHSYAEVVSCSNKIRKRGGKPRIRDACR